MAKSTNPFRSFDSSPEVIRLVVMMYVKYLLPLRIVEDLLHERGSHFGMNTSHLPANPLPRQGGRTHAADLTCEYHFAMASAVTPG